MKKGSRKASGLVVVLMAMCLSGSGASAASDSTTYLSDPETLPAGLYPALVRALQRDAPAGYGVVALNHQAAAYQADNAAQDLAIAYSAEGIVVEPQGASTWRLGMALVGYGYGADIRPAPAPRLVVAGNRVEYRRGGTEDEPLLSEWYVNGPLGLEQGFTLAGPPPGDAKPQAELVLVLALSGSLQPVLAKDGGGMRLHNPDGVTVLSYDGLYAFDATGRRLPARLALANNRLSIRVDDSAAIYPVTIDPLVARETKLTAGDAAQFDNFGTSVAISGDTAVVGALFDVDSGISSGSAYVFQRSAGVWSQQQKLTASDAAANDQFGASVAISGDTAVVSSPGDDDAGTNSGSAYVFIRSAGVWSQEAKLTASDGTGSDGFGGSVAISGDTVVVGASRDDDAGTSSGSAYVFIRSAGVWSEQAKLIASDAAGGDFFGGSVAISGESVVVGAFNDDDTASDSGSAYVFQRSGTTWSQEAKLTASDAALSDFFGFSVAISGDTAVVGAHLDDDAGGDSGSAYVFQRSAGVWSEQQKLTASDAALADEFGFSVAISGGAPWWWGRILTTTRATFPARPMFSSCSRQRMTSSSTSGPKSASGRY